MNFEAIKKKINRACQALEKKKTHSDINKLIQNPLAVRDYINKLVIRNDAKRISKAFYDLLIPAINLSERGRYKEAFERYELVIEISGQFLESGNKIFHDIFLTAKGCLADLLRNVGRLKEAKACYERGLLMSETRAEEDENLFYQDKILTFHNQLGNLLSSMGRLNDAQIHLKKAIEINETLLKGRIPEVEYQGNSAIGLTNLGILLGRMGRSSEALTKLEQAHLIFTKVYESNCEDIENCLVFATSNNNLGDFYRMIGRFEDAKHHLEQSHKIYEKLLSLDKENIQSQKDVALANQNLGGLLSDMGRFKQAKSYYCRAKTMREEILKVEENSELSQRECATSYRNLGALLVKLGDFKAAMTFLEQAYKQYKILASSDNENELYHSDLADVQNELAILHHQMGHIEEACGYHEKALSMRENLLSKDKNSDKNQNDMSISLNNLANFYISENLPEKAKVKFEQAFNIRKNLLKKNEDNSNYQIFFTSSCDSLGNLLVSMGRLEEAFFYFREAFMLRLRLLATDKDNIEYQINVATTCNNLGLLTSDMDQLEESLAFYSDALLIYEELLATDEKNIRYFKNVARTINNKGCSLFRLGENKDAKIHFKQALEMYKKILSTERDSKNVIAYRDVVNSHHNLGLLLSGTKNFDEALIHFNEAFRFAHYIHDPDLLSKMRDGRAGCYEQLKRFDEAFIDYKESIKQAEILRQQFSVEEYRLDLMKNIAWKYSSIINFLTNIQRDAAKAWYYVSRAKSRSMLDFLRFTDISAPASLPKASIEKEYALIVDIKRKDKQARVLNEGNKVSILSQELTELNDELDQLYDQMAEIAPDYVGMRRGLPLSFGGIRELLKQQSCKTAFVEYYISYDSIFIFVLTTNSETPRLVVTEICNLQIIDYILRYHQEIVEFNNEAPLNETWHEISNYLLSPISDVIEDCDLLYFVPHGLLHELPLHALILNGKRLIELLPVVYISSLTQLKYAQLKHDVMPGTCLTLGYTQHKEKEELFEREARQVANLFMSEPFLGENATKERLIVQGALGYDIIHISCHGDYDSNNPLESNIHLSDGKLTAREIFNIDIKANLLVLSVCDTGINEQRSGDELIGLTRAFLYAGVKSILVTLWPVFDTVTIEFMKSFYNKIKKNKSKAEALQLTQIEMIQNDLFSNPHYWGAFMLIGDWK